MNISERLQGAIRNIPDFPSPGIQFKDISTVFMDADLCRDLVRELASRVTPSKPQAIAGIESRGFLLGTALAMELGIPFIMIRKAGKLPADTYSQDYALEYGQATIEVHCDAIQRGMRICIHDDVLATGGTVQATHKLITAAGGQCVSACFLLELSFLEGRNLLSNSGLQLHSLARY
jgi:adenine phosphoribosyltransferase